jgi:hypothetical protein
VFKVQGYQLPAAFTGSRLLSRIEVLILSSLRRSKRVQMPAAFKNSSKYIPKTIACGVQSSTKCQIPN